MSHFVGNVPWLYVQRCGLLGPMAPRLRNEHLARAFGERLVQKRTEAGLSQERMAADADIDRSYASYVERGKAVPSLDTIVRLAEALHVDPADLVAGLSSRSGRL